MPCLEFRLTHRENQGRPVVQITRPITLQGYAIPKRFRTDFGSIPLPLRWLIPIFGRSCKATVLHDWLCYVGMDRGLRSSLFYRQMIEDGVPSWQAVLQSVAVKYWPGPEKITGEIVPPTA